MKEKNVFGVDLWIITELKNLIVIKPKYQKRKTKNKVKLAN